MPRPTIRHQRFHVSVDKRRTTVSLDDWLAWLLAARLGEDPGGRRAAGRLRAWLQERTAEDPGGPGLNRRLIRRTVLEVADKELSNRCAAWLDRSGGAAPPEKPLRPRELPRPAVPTPPSASGRFVLYRAAHAQGLAPDILARGTSVENARAGAGEIYEEDERRPAIMKAALITTEKERHGAYYIRRCSEEYWAALAARREIRPVADSAGVWLTRAELARTRKATAWRDALRHWARPRRKGG